MTPGDRLKKALARVLDKIKTFQPHQKMRIFVHSLEMWRKLGFFTESLCYCKYWVVNEKVT